MLSSSRPTIAVQGKYIPFAVNAGFAYSYLCKMCSVYMTNNDNN